MCTYYYNQPTKIKSAKIIPLGKAHFNGFSVIRNSVSKTLFTHTHKMQLMKTHTACFLKHLNEQILQQQIKNKNTTSAYRVITQLQGHCSTSEEKEFGKQTTQEETDLFCEVMEKLLCFSYILKYFYTFSFVDP